jgi:hypothetical protein
VWKELPFRRFLWCSGLVVAGLCVFGLFLFHLVQMGCLFVGNSLSSRSTSCSLKIPACSVWCLWTCRLCSGFSLVIPFWVNLPDGILSPKLANRCGVCGFWSQALTGVFSARVPPEGGCPSVLGVV